MTTVLVDTTMGNLRSVERALGRAGVKVVITNDPEELRRADRLVVPGQGGFGDFARALGGGLGAAIKDHVRAGRPYLGICLGMQILFERSAEAPEVAGLGLLQGEVRRLPARVDPGDASRRLKVPHMGWNEVEGSHPLLDGSSWFYFVHSYHCLPSDTSTIAGLADYGGPIVAAVADGPLFACQFHPEKSQRAGERLLEHFLRS